MGGLGSGSWCAKGYETVENTGALSVSAVLRSACFTESERPESVTIRYRVGVSDNRVTDILRFVRTHPHFGGIRLWFLCRCGRRAAKLYRPESELYFQCRACYRLVYQCQRETRTDRLFRRSQRLLNRLDPRGEFGWHYEGHRPKGMHFDTYLRLRDDEVAFRLEAMQRLLKKQDREAGSVQ